MKISSKRVLSAIAACAMAGVMCGVTVFADSDNPEQVEPERVTTAADENGDPNVDEGDFEELGPENPAEVTTAPIVPEEPVVTTVATVVTTPVVTPTDSTPKTGNGWVAGAVAAAIASLGGAAYFGYKKSK